ncbi:uncharacterized protein METZ01_LOCUS386988, partial [marine metagenome]
MPAGVSKLRKRNFTHQTFCNFTE